MNQSEEQLYRQQQRQIHANEQLCRMAEQARTEKRILRLEQRVNQLEAEVKK